VIRRGKRFTRSLVSALAATAVVATGLAASGTAAQAAPPSPSADAKIRPELMSKLQTDREADFWIRFRDKADLKAASQIKDWNARGEAVVAALQKTAAQSQAGTKASLTSQGVQFKAYWGSNAIKVTSGSLSLAQSMAARAEVEGLYLPVAYKTPEITKGAAEHTVNAVEWGIANIKADQVWAQYGVKGAGITVANIDTGVQFDHPALVTSYRGNNGDGTFNHNYNWFAAAGSCTAPCDTNGHGTHTMGTMAGLDGANQIGVAPEVNWIAANGCCPTDQALIDSGEWMLMPRDLNDQNPDVSKRPNIINNSWGSTLPSNDPFMEDISNAWTASGIFGMWANGNSGTLGCNSSGSPGSRIINHSAGNYDINNNINASSGRGVGQDGEIKPNISAPGTNVRSSVPGNGYANFSGTSMASPHVAGTIALLWSASEALRGNVAATRALLDNTAVDKADSQCGGTADDNNVYGEGRLDALALLNAAPIGDTGTLSGKVTDAGDGTAVAGAKVTISGAADRELTTGADGTYSVLLPVGDYQVAVSAFGYIGQTAAATITTDQTTTKDFALQPAPSATVSGAVTDGSGHGWPLYAKVTVEGPGGVLDYTNPVDGQYSFSVPSGATYTITVDPVYPGYKTVSQQVVVGSADTTHNVAVPVDTNTCTTAPGYTYGSDGEYETFDGTTAPAGWTVVDNIGNGQVWKFDDPGGRNNLTGGTGGFAVVDSDEYGISGRQDTSLVSPVVDLSDVAAPVIRFNQDYNNNGPDRADVDLSIDGGATWTTVLQQAVDTRGPRQTEIAIPQAAGQAQVQVRFHYYNAIFEWWWEVDNVLIGSEVRCDPVNGGLVLGHVRDANTDAGVNGATVTSNDKPAEKATSAATPEDAGLADGFYWFFSSRTGQHPLTATAGNYVQQSQQVDIEADGATAANFTLAAGQLSVTPGEVSSTLRMPTGQTTRSFTLENTGGAPVDVELSERNGTFELLRADGSRVTEQQVLGSDGAPEQRLDAPVSFAAQQTGKSAVPAVQLAPQDDPWTNIANYPASVMDNRVVNLDGKVYSIAGSNGSASTTKNFVYDPATQAWTAIADLPAARNAMTVGVVDGKIVASGGWGPSGPDAGTWAYDPASNSWTAAAANPLPRSAAGQAVVDGKLYAVGGCTTAACTPMSNDVVRYDPASNAWEPLPDYPQAVAFASCGGIDGVVYCTGGNNGSAAVANSYAFDPGIGTWTAVPNAPRDSWASSFAVANGKLLVVGGVQAGSITNAGFAYDPTTESWSNLPNANVPRYRGGAACGFYKIGGSSGGFAATPASEVLPGLEECAEAGADVSWLSLDRTTATLAPGQQVTVRVTMTAQVDQPGTYTAGVGIKENSPYSVQPVGVTMNVTPPLNWGKLMGTVSGTNCQGVSAPLPGAVVQVDSATSSFTFTTDAEGKYAHWLGVKNNPLTVIAAKDGWMPQTRETRVSPSTPKVENFALAPTRC